MPHKTWAVGEEVLAADFNSYLQNQTVPQFPNTAARDTWSAPPKGALCVTTDTNTIWLRGTSAWQTLVMTGRYGQTNGTIASGTAGLEGTITFGVTFAAVPIVVATVIVGANYDLVVNWGTTPTTTNVPYRVITKNGTNVSSSTPFGIQWAAHGLLA